MFEMSKKAGILIYIHNYYIIVIVSDNDIITSQSRKSRGTLQNNLPLQNLSILQGSYEFRKSSESNAKSLLFATCIYFINEKIKFYYDITEMERKDLSYSSRY